MNVNFTGEMGEKVLTPEEQMGEKKEKFKIHQFNLLVSDQISVNRSLKDVRMEACRSKKYPEALPTTSIVIVFHNEAWSTLLRSLHSIINRSPKGLGKRTSIRYLIWTECKADFLILFTLTRTIHVLCYPKRHGNYASSI